MREVFEMAPGGSSVHWFLGGMILLMAALLALFLFMAWSTKNASFELDAHALHLRGDLWGRSIPRSSLLADEARIVDLRHETGLRPRRKTMGSAFPGYASGWFKLHNGEKSLLYLTDRSHSVHVPTTEGYSLLLSPADPTGFLSALQRGRS